MSDDIEEQFSEIAQEAMSAASAVECSMSDYRDGLRSIIDELKVALRAAEEDLSRGADSDDEDEDDDDLDYGEVSADLED